MALAPLAAMAGDPPPPFGRYLPKYPAYYYTVAYAYDERDSSFGRNGRDHGSAVPTLAGKTSFPESRLEASFVSYFPLFEDAAIPFLSDRLHSARMTLRYGASETEGAMRDFIATNPEFRPRSKYGDSGAGDVSFEFGSFLLGGKDWRTRKDNPFALVLLAGFDVPTGSYEQTSPVVRGTNRLAYGAALGVHWRAWSGGFVEAGAGLREYSRNQNAHFGRLAPAQQGRDVLLNASVTQRLFRGAYAGAFLSGRRGGANEYAHVHYAPNAPPPNPAPPDGTTESFPIDGIYHDDGTALLTGGLSLNYFITQRVMATLDYALPLSGKSGQFLVPFRQRQCPEGSLPGSPSCTEADQGEVLLDGQGTSRSFSSDSLSFSLSYNFGHADHFSCTGCRQ